MKPFASHVIELKRHYTAVHFLYTQKEGNSELEACIMEVPHFTHRPTFMIITQFYLKCVLGTTFPYALDKGFNKTHFMIHGA
jgi:hypothetical protein